MALHNAERAKLGLHPLKWNPQLAERARAWAEELTRMDGLEHADDADYADGDMFDGENLWRGTKGAYTPEDMVGLWLDERKIFVNGPFPRNATNGRWREVSHYTQIVWRTTREMGCAIADQGQDEILVCRYAEGGNVIGEWPY